MKRLAVILPYDKDHIDNFTDHFKTMINEDKFYYKLCFMKQKSNRPLNKGKLFNIGYFLNKDKFDYFCFHDIDMIPISDECNYEYEEKPISIVSGLANMEFGDQEKIDNFDYFDLPYDEYFGGSILLTKEHFAKINGYSNEYWGLGYEDYDLLLRCVVKQLPIRTEIENQVSKTYGTFNGMNSYIEIPTDNAKIKNSTNKSFSMCSWFYPDGEPSTSADRDTNNCEYFIFGRPGYHTGISYTHGGFVKCVIWVRPFGTSDKSPVIIQVPLRHSTWHHIGMIVDDKAQTLTLFIDGKEAGKQTYEGELIDYLNKPYYIGVGDPNINVWRNFLKGNVSEVGLWNDNIKDYEMELIFNKGIVNNKGEYTTSKLPVGVWDFKGGYDNITFDISGNGNHARFYNVGFENKSLKNKTERYLPYRRNGYYGCISTKEDFSNLENMMRSEHPEIMTNRNLFNKKIRNSMDDMDKDGLSSTRFRIVNRENYQDKHEVIEVVI